MRQRTIILTAFAPLALLAVLASACAGARGPQAETVATTAWTAAYAQAAGIDACLVLAPYDMRHPAEYELRPADLKTVAEAKIFVYAGYETMMKNLASQIATDKIVMVQIATDYDPASMEKSILAIADAAGTRERALKNIAGLKETFAACRAEITSAFPAGVASVSALVHAFQKPTAELFGLTVAGAFGPQPLEAKQIADLAQKDAALIIDNWHNPVSAPLREILKRARYAELINFPGPGGTLQLADVLRYNKERLLEAFAAR